MRRTARLPACIIGALVGLSGAAGPASGQDVGIGDSADVVIVTTVEPPTTRWSLTAEPVWTIGDAPDDPPLYDVVGVVAVDSSRVVIANGGGHEILVYGDGVLRSGMGRVGGGPGEFEDLSGIGPSWTLTTDGALVIGCSSSTGLTLEGGDGAVQVSVPPRPPIERTAGEIEWFEVGLRARGAPSDVPTTHPPISGLLPTADDRFLVVAASPWYGRLIPEEDRRPGGLSHTWEREEAGDVFLFDGDTGDYLATIPLPDSAQYRPHWPYAPPALRDDRMWLVLVEPTTEVQSVGAFRLRW